MYKILFAVVFLAALYFSINMFLVALSWTLKFLLIVVALGGAAYFLLKPTKEKK